MEKYKAGKVPLIPIFDIFGSPVIPILKEAEAVYTIPPWHIGVDGDYHGIVGFAYQGKEFEVGYMFDEYARRIYEADMLEELLEQRGLVAVPKGK